MNKAEEQKGFTLVEMLIVVAIIAILVAVSIPMVNATLERARQATDAANERAAKAEITICYLTDSEYAPGKKVIASDSGTYPDLVKCYAYDAASGKLMDKEQANATPPNCYGKCSKHKDQYLVVWIHKDGEVKMLWRKQFPVITPPDSWTIGTDLCSNTLNG